MHNNPHVSGIARKISIFSTSDIAALFKAARVKIKERGVEIRLAPARINYARILSIISKKVGNAPTRNLIRRRLKSIFYEEALFEKGYDCIVITNKDAATLSFAELKDIVLKAWK